MGLPSVRHSPLPLQSFLPLVVPHPPLPLQEFLPLQACFSFLLFVAFLPDCAALSPPVSCAMEVREVPATNPDRAAPTRSARIDFVMWGSSFFYSSVRKATIPGLRSRKKRSPEKLLPCACLRIVL